MTLISGCLYCCKTVFFKVVDDPAFNVNGETFYLYGGSKKDYENAAKSAGNELRAAKTLMNISVNDIKIPLEV